MGVAQRKKFGQASETVDLVEESGMNLSTKLRYALAQKIIGRPWKDNLMALEAAEVYQDIWPKHERYDEDNKKAIAFALLKAYTAGVADATRRE